MPKPKLILASSSPRRRELLIEAGYDFQVVEPEPAAECGLCSGEGPAALVTELAYRKAANVRKRVTDGTIVACDTVAECRGQILGKPVDREHAQKMLSVLSGREHRVYSGICVWRVGTGTSASQANRKPDVRFAVTTLRMDVLSERQLDDYLESHAWEGKAGAFGYQDRLGWVHIIDGSPSNVVGLPIELLAEMLCAKP